MNNIPTIRCNPEFDRQDDYMHFHMHRNWKSLRGASGDYIYSTSAFSRRKYHLCNLGRLWKRVASLCWNKKKRHKKGRFPPICWDFLWPKLDFRGWTKPFFFSFFFLMASFHSSHTAVRANRAATVVWVFDQQGTRPQWDQSPNK